ncbi:KpsF/GutQ family sugar-phosphate isomerase [bacterium]|nr:KpsF/GutQ family sugar-phosphate isomerase [bacterium]
MPKDILAEARNIIRKELQAVENTSNALDDGFVGAVQMIHNSKGKVVVTGVGKSGLIGQKIAATMSSTGTVAVYLHATDALHGDLGMVGENDVVLALSHSGQSDEILALITPIRRIGAKIVAMVGRSESDLAQAADFVIRLDVPCEADHLNLAPTASAVATLAVGDAMAGCLSKLKGFRDIDFARYHPAGAIGRRLLLRVKDLMHCGPENPMVTPEADVEEIIAVLTEKRLGGVNVVSDPDSCRLEGIIVDGDIRRALKFREKFFDLKAADIMTRNPTVIHAEEMAVHALELMENRPFQIAFLPVLNAEERAIGVLRLHDLLKMT